MIETPPAAATALTSEPVVQSGRSIGLAVLRVTLGIIILVAWFDNLSKDLYTGDGLTGLIDWLFAEDGNNSSLTFYQSILDAVVVPAAGLVSKVQLVVELGMAISLILGVFTRLFSLATVLFFVSLFLGYFGGEEWIWTYVILAASALAVFLGYAGRSFGVDTMIAKTRGASPFGLIW